MSNFMKILPVGDELFHADGRTDMTKLIVAFRHFANSPKNGRDILRFAGIICAQMWAHLCGKKWCIPTDLEALL